MLSLKYNPAQKFCSHFLFFYTPRKKSIKKVHYEITLRLTEKQTNLVFINNQHLPLFN